MNKVNRQSTLPFAKEFGSRSQNGKSNLKVIMMCAGNKRPAPLVVDGIPLNIVAISNPIQNKYHPDANVPGQNIKIRDLIFNEQDNPHTALHPAYFLYNHLPYMELYNYFGDNLYIQSAGWGIVRSRFKLPEYNITFSQNADPENRRGMENENNFHDFNHLADDLRAEKNENDKLVFIGTKHYIPQFWNLTNELPNPKVIYLRNGVGVQPWIPEEYFVRYETLTRTNWHYELARSIINGDIIP